MSSCILVGGEGKQIISKQKKFEYSETIHLSQ